MNRSGHILTTKYRKIAAALAVCLLAVSVLTGCTPEASNVGQAKETADGPGDIQNGFPGDPSSDDITGMPQTASATESGTSAMGSASDAVIYTTYNYLPVGTYDSADVAILKKIDPDERKVTLYNTIAAKTYTLNYDGTTYVTDKYGTAMSMAQMTEGTIVDVNFYKATKQLVNMQVSPDAWSYDSVTRYDLGGINSTATIGDRTYALTKGVQVFSEGRQTDLMNIVDGDAITVSGIGPDIYSIRVSSGHGYVRLTHDEALIGGWVEIGGTLITKISESGMLLTVPEGTYNVRMYNDNSSVTQEITVNRNEEVVLDCSGVTAPVETYGQILFHVTPETATLSLDGVSQDISHVVKAEYGIHQIEVSAPGYDTLSRYVNVGTELSEITINLEESVAYTSGNSSDDFWDRLWRSISDNARKVSGNSASGNSASGNKTSGNAASGNKTSGNKTSGNKTTDNKPVKTVAGYNRVYVYSPEGVEVYLDGAYVGLTPLNFKKTPGSHTLVLKKSGYVTRSYTVYMFDDAEDMCISFSDLEKIPNPTEEVTDDEDETEDETDDGDDDGTETGDDDGGTGSDDADTDDTADDTDDSADTTDPVPPDTTENESGDAPSEDTSSESEGLGSILKHLPWRK